MGHRSLAVAVASTARERGSSARRSTVLPRLVRVQLYECNLAEDDASSGAHQELVESEPPSVEALAQRYGYTYLRLAQYPPRPFFRFLCGSRTRVRVHLRLAFSSLKIRSMCEGPGTRARGSKDERGSRATPASVAMAWSVMSTHMHNAYAQPECSRSGAYASSSG